MVKTGSPIVTALLLAACSADMESPSAPYRAHVLNLHPPRTATEVPTFRLESVEFSTAIDPRRLVAQDFRIMFGGNWEIRTVRGSIMTGEGFGGGEEPRLEYEIENGVMVPRNYQTLVLLSAFRNFDLLFSRLEGLTGLARDDLLAQRSALTVWFEPRIDLVDEGTSTSITSKLNAAFLPEQGQFLLFERSEAEVIPLAANLQVIAHEFGHAVFDRLFFGANASGTSHLAENYALSGFNEGYADFFSFLMTGSANVLGASLSGMTAVDERNFAASQFTYATSILALDRKCGGDFYCIGTLYARSLYNVYRALADDGERSAFRTALSRTLGGLRERLEDSLDPEPSVKKIDESVFLFLSEFANLFAVEMPARKAAMCAELRAAFPFVGAQQVWWTICGN